MVLLLAKPNFVSLMFCLGFLFLGTFILAGYLARRTTPENELTEVEGIPYRVRKTSRHNYHENRNYIDFNVGSFQTSYASDEPFADKVFDAVQSGQPIKAWFSTKNETLLDLGGGFTPLYKMQAGDELIVDYQTSVAQMHEMDPCLLLAGVVLSLFGLCGIYSFYQHRKRYLAETTGFPENRT